MARVYEDSSDMDDEIEWVSDASDYVSDEDTLSLPETSSLPAENFPIIWEVIKKSADRNFDGNALDAMSRACTGLPSISLTVVLHIKKNLR